MERVEMDFIPQNGLIAGLEISIGNEESCPNMGNCNLYTYLNARLQGGEDIDSLRKAVCESHLYKICKYAVN